jgi:hypothetical protein
LPECRGAAEAKAPRSSECCDQMGEMSQWGTQAMIRRMLLGAAAAIALLSVAAGSSPALACTKSTGCTYDVLYEDYKMMHDGRMEEAMKAGRANMEAFRALREAEQSKQVRR